MEEVRCEDADSEYALTEALLDQRSWWPPCADPLLEVLAGPKTSMFGTLTAESGDEVAVVESSNIVVGVSGGKDRAS